MNPPKLTDPGRAHQGIEQPALMEALIQAAEQLLVEHGPEGVSAIRIASRAGVSLGTLMQCFRNKDAIIAEAMARQRRAEASTPSSRSQPAASSRLASGSTPAAARPPAAARAPAPGRAPAAGRIPAASSRTPPAAAEPRPAPPPASALFRKPAAAPKPDPEPAPAPRPVATARPSQAPAPAPAATARATQEPAPRAAATARATQEPAPRAAATARATQEPAPRAAATARATQEPAPRAAATARATQEPAPAPRAAAAAPVASPVASPAPAPAAPAETLEDGLLSVLRPFVSTIAAVLPSWPSLPQADRDAIFRVELKRLAAASEAMLARQHVSDPGQVAYVMTHSCDKVVKDAIRHAPESFTDGRLEQALGRLCLDFVRST